MFLNEVRNPPLVSNLFLPFFLPILFFKLEKKMDTWIIKLSNTIDLTKPTKKTREILIGLLNVISCNSLHYSSPTPVSLLFSRFLCMTNLDDIPFLIRTCDYVQVYPGFLFFFYFIISDFHFFFFFLVLKKQPNFPLLPLNHFFYCFEEKKIEFHIYGEFSFLCKRTWNRIIVTVCCFQSSWCSMYVRFLLCPPENQKQYMCGLVNEIRQKKYPAAYFFIWTYNHIISLKFYFGWSVFRLATSQQ